jgi:hypothetical protein
MRLEFCAACGSTEDLQHHHLVATARGGKWSARSVLNVLARL